MADPVNSSDEAVEAAIERVAQSLMEAQYPPGTVQDGCLAPVWAEWVADPDPDAQSFVEAYRAMARPDPSILAAVRAEVVADERRRIADEIAQDIHGATLANPELTADFGYNRGLEKAADIARRRGSFDVRASDLLGAWSDGVAAGSVPVATPTPVGEDWPSALERLAKAGPAMARHEVATPPAEPAATVHDANCEQQLGACCCHCQKRSDVAFSHAAPSQSVTCEHGETVGHWASTVGPRVHWLWCPGPVSVPKESSE